MCPRQGSSRKHCPLPPAAAGLWIGRWLLPPLGSGQSLHSAPRTPGPIDSQEGQTRSTHRKWLLESKLQFSKPENDSRCL